MKDNFTAHDNLNEVKRHTDVKGLKSDHEKTIEGESLHNNRKDYKDAQQLTDCNSDKLKKEDE